MKVNLNLIQYLSFFFSTDQGCPILYLEIETGLGYPGIDRQIVKILMHVVIDQNWKIS